MTKQNETLQEELLRQLDEMMGWESLHNALNKSLPNDGDDVDYEKWHEGIKRFDEANKDLIKAMMK